MRITEPMKAPEVFIDITKRSGEYFVVCGTCGWNMMFLNLGRAKTVAKAHRSAFHQVAK